jgi:hypothetical protein
LKIFYRKIDGSAARFDDICVRHAGKVSTVRVSGWVRVIPKP